MGPPPIMNVANSMATGTSCEGMLMKKKLVFWPRASWLPVYARARIKACRRKGELRPRRLSKIMIKVPTNMRYHMTSSFLVNLGLDVSICERYM